MTVTIDPAEVAERYREEIRMQLSAIRTPLRLQGILAGDHGPSHTYALYAQRACTELGIDFELSRHPRLEAEAAIRAANADPHVHGIMIYYPIFGPEHDAYLRDLVEPGKDIEGLHSTWARALYENRRFVDAQKTKKAILPCTPLAILKLIEAAGFFRPEGPALEGRTVTIFNRSEVVGRPLASMLAHDGARVYSFDEDGALLFDPPRSAESAHRLCETAVTRQRALAESDIVITGVPSKKFELVHAKELRPKSLCINFSTFKNFSDDIDGKVACFVPRVGPMTVVMVIRNALRLHENAEHD
jgi:methylenetetrahydrofolate dehydrogenase (NADP+) / methenyltetrahydrofolate cyclohydrolase